MEYGSLPDEELGRRFREGDATAFESLLALLNGEPQNFFLDIYSGVPSLCRHAETEVKKKICVLPAVQ